MKRKVFRRVIKSLFISGLILYASVLQAGTFTANGITSTITQSNHKVYIDSVIQSAYEATATMTYNSVGGTSLSSGAIRIEEHNEELNIQIKVATLGSTTLVVHVEGIFGSDANLNDSYTPLSTASWSDIYEKTFTAVTATNYDYQIPISEKGVLKWIRVGCKTTGDAADSVSIWLRGAGGK